MEAVLPSGQRTQSGEVDAVSRHPPLHELFRAHAPFVFRVLRRLGVAEAEVEDVCQEVFMVVHRGLPRFEGRSSLRTWIYAIALRRASNHKSRAFRRYEHTTDAPPERCTAADPAQALERSRTRALLDELLGQLAEDKRQVFVLYELEELSMREVAEIVGCPLQTAYGRLYAARRELQELARRRGVTP
jgi:RNA polymerase sigma-70 factor (ECF subfamily)